MVPSSIDLGGTGLAPGSDEANMEGGLSPSHSFFGHGQVQTYREREKVGNKNKKQKINISDRQSEIKRIKDRES